MPLNEPVLHDLAFIERLLDNFLSYENELFDSIPEDFNADALIYALKTKFGDRKEVENEQRS